jgi:hypothetical protein
VPRVQRQIEAWRKYLGHYAWRLFKINLENRNVPKEKPK